MDGPGIESRWGRYFRTCPDRPWVPPSLLYNGYRVFPGVKRGRAMTLSPQPLLVPWSWKGRAVPLLPLWAVQPVQSLSACTRVHSTLFHLIPRLRMSGVVHLFPSTPYTACRETTLLFMLHLTSVGLMYPEYIYWRVTNETRGISDLTYCEASLSLWWRKNCGVMFLSSEATMTSLPQTESDWNWVGG